MARVLILACGNPLRGDDGVAWHAAEALRQTLPPDQAEIFCFHQFAPELAEVSSHAAAVIFLDAAAKGTPGQVICEPVGTETSDSRFSHHLTPAAVMTLSRQLYGANPQAFVVSLCGECFDHGEELSPAVVAALPEFVGAVKQLVSEMSRNPSQGKFAG
jgi:hydrogenase maturation protease